ncbi:MAG: flagellar export chaperone FlgN [Deltaproteobacteria bacterium]|nr:flagellar export chaperone FlgN [Deltaproteobacteria bacterium]
MESVSGKMEVAYRKKVSLLRELLGCLVQEKENLIVPNVQNLWSLMEEKQRLLVSISEAEEEIRGLRNQETCVREASGTDRNPVVVLSHEIRRLGEEIKARVRENVSFIQETLLFFDQIISIFASGGRVEYSYPPVLKRQRAFSSPIYKREV